MQRVDVHEAVLRELEARDHEALHREAIARAAVVAVARKISDGVPLTVTTRLSLRVSGRAREIVLGKVTLPDTVPFELSSELPARLTPEGELRVQARAGIHRIEITSRTLAGPTALQWRAPGKHWPAIETWVWQADEALRQVRLDAEMKREWRLSLQQGALGRVNDGSRDLLITQDARGHAGVELRNRNNSLLAEWRDDALHSELPAVAWSEDVQSLQAHLHMGPGWSVLAASGVDSISSSWVQDWDLFGFFFVLVLALAFGKLFGVRMGLLALGLVRRLGSRTRGTRSGQVRSIADRRSVFGCCHPAPTA